MTTAEHPTADTIAAEHRPPRALSPRIAVVMCTRNRPNDVAKSLPSLLASAHPSFELILVDQSPGKETQAVVDPYLEDARLHYVRSETKGISAARNIGSQLAQTDLVAMTDDDCEVDSAWLEQFEREMLSRPKCGLLYCRVKHGDYDKSAGYVPVCDLDLPWKAVRAGEITKVWGIGAGMMVRKSAVLEAGGFDELLGAGARFHSHEDVAIAFSMLKHGHEVEYTPSVTVTHHGFRTWKQFREMTYGTFMGIGAGHSQMIRLHPILAVKSMTLDLAKHVLAPILKNVLRGKLPPVRSRVAGWMKGFIEGLRTPIDRSNGRFAA